jgi:signal transduction histidine kinase
VTEHASGLDPLRPGEHLLAGGAESLALLAEAAAGGVLVGSSLSLLLALALLLYCAGRYARGPLAFAGAAGCAALLASTRVAFDPAARAPRDAVLTFVAVACPLVLGRWAREQGLLHRELAARAVRRERDRAQATRHAAEEERERIAADLQVAVAGSLRRIAGEAEAVQRDVAAGRAAPARDRFDAVAQMARSALADVRRILGVLRHEGEPRRLTPPQTGLVPAARPDPPAPAADPSATESGPALREPPARGRGAWRPRLDDVLLAAAVAAISGTELAFDDSAAVAATALVVAAPLIVRRRRPVAAAAAVLAAVGLQSAIGGPDSFPFGDMLAMVLATYSIGAHAAPTRAWVGMLAIGAGSVAHAAAFHPDSVVPALLGGVVLPWSVGRVVRGNRDRTRAELRRNEDIERSRAQEERAAVTRERVRVARELHDAVAHSISVIAIQAGGAAGLVERDPERAAACAALIASVAEEALGELDRLTAGHARADARAAPGLAHIDQLAERARAAGLAVSVSVDGAAGDLPAGVDLAAFRIVQEALTNTVKHAHASRADVSVRCGPRLIELEVADDGRGPPSTAVADGGGHGLVGMRERVALYGGSIDVGPAAREGGFRVRASLPLGSA